MPQRECGRDGARDRDRERDAGVMVEPGEIMHIISLSIMPNKFDEK